MKRHKAHFTSACSPENAFVRLLRVTQKRYEKLKKSRYYELLLNIFIYMFVNCEHSQQLRPLPSNEK